MRAVCPGAAVLGNVGRNGRGNALLRREGKIVHPRDRVERCDSPDPQRVDLPLNEHLADRLHGLLHRRHRAVAQNRPQQVAADVPLPLPGAELRHAACHVDGGQQCAGGLGHDSGHGAAHNAKAQPAN